MCAVCNPQAITKPSSSKAPTSAEEKLRFWRGLVIAIVVAGGVLWWASNRDPGPRYATQAACEEEHPLCDYVPARTEDDGYTRHKAFWFPVDPSDLNN